MKRFFYLFFSVIIAACSNTQENGNVSEAHSMDSLEINTVALSDDSGEEIKLDSLASGLNFIPGNNYNNEKAEIAAIRSGLSDKYLNSSDSAIRAKLLDSAMVTFTDMLLNNIVPYWYETTWDFEGHTSIPRQGTIACGYFVSTTLRDMGLKLNRYRLAQQGPENEAKSIAINASAVLHFNSENIFEKLKSLEDGLYFVGLDFHVGYLYINNSIGYFIHSNYIDGKVMIESPTSSEAFMSTFYYLSKIAGNKALMEKWLNQDEVQVIVD